MRKSATKRIVFLLAVFLATSCQQLVLQREQAEYDREHAERCRQEYHEHVEKQQQAVPNMRSQLAKAEKALWRWVYDCDACDESLIPGDIPLNHAEFEEVQALLKQASPLPPLPQEAFMSETPRVALTPNGEVLKPVIIPPWMNRGGDVSPMLIFQDSNGEECYYWDFSMATPTSRVQECLRKKDTWLHPHMQIPDAAYEQLRNLPSAVKVRQADEAFQQLLKQQH